ncbi:MAG: cobalamin biosynthesis protein [Hyphomicrobiales bacterium]|nr:cobalamin biosynthesis protein [Hyphomicrobiales bacterium]
MKTIAIGVGCRKDASAESIAALAREALARLPRRPDQIRLFSSARKADEAGLQQAAVALGCEIAFLDDADLLAASDRVVTRSAKSREVTGLDSLAEAAALAGAGPRAKIVVPRLTSPEAACAIAAIDGDDA